MWDVSVQQGCWSTVFRTTKALRDVGSAGEGLMLFRHYACMASLPLFVLKIRVCGARNLGNRSGDCAHTSKSCRGFLRVHSFIPNPWSHLERKWPRSPRNALCSSSCSCSRSSWSIERVGTRDPELAQLSAFFRGDAARGA